MTPRAFAPGHVSGFFEICLADTEVASGSRGAGICLTRGATATVEPTNKGHQVLLNGHPGGEVTCLALDLLTDAPLPVGTVGTVLIVLESGQDRLEVRCQCKVARVVGKKDGASAGMGLEYVVLDPDSSLTLYNVIKYQGGIEDMEGGV